MKIMLIFILGWGMMAGHAHAKPHSFAIILHDGPKKTVVMTDADMLAYDFAWHNMTVRADVLVRLHRLQVGGKSFDVMVDDECIYSGQFSHYDSRSPWPLQEIRIWVTDSEPKESTATLSIVRPTHIRRFFEQENRLMNCPDPRSDVRIRRTLKALGKVKEEPAGNEGCDKLLTQKISAILMDCMKITPGSTREDLLKIFTMEGGLSDAKQRTYVHRRCPYIKVDVSFDLSDAKRDAFDERPTDTIREISLPYLQWAVSD